MRTLRFVIVFVSLLALTLSASAQQKNAPQAKPCSSGDYRLLDFWVGDWSLTWPDSPGGTPAGQGTNKISRTLDNCVIQELFEADKPVGLHGMSLSTFDRPSGKWKQTWVDNSGSYLDFMGDVHDDGAIFMREAKDKDGNPIKQRMVYKNFTKDEFDWSWEKSDDGGATWKVMWPIHYTRMSKAKVQQKEQGQKKAPWYKQW